MSRIGKTPIEVPAGVVVSIDPGRVMVSGPQGRAAAQVSRSGSASSRATGDHRHPPDRAREDRALHGLTRTLVANMVEGVTKGFEKRLEIQGVGYRAALSGTNLELQVGYSHPCGSSRARASSSRCRCRRRSSSAGSTSRSVGQTAAEIRKVRPPEPYKGKGIRYEGEYVRRKVGKRA